MSDVPTRRHMCISISGALRRPEGELNGFIVDTETGREYSDAEVRRELMNHELKGYKLWTGCNSVDQEGRCLGHPIEEDEEESCRS